MPRAERLRRKRDVDAVRRRGRRLRDQLMTLILLPVPAPERRVAFSVGRRVAKKATVRNKVRRWLREAYRNLRPQLRGGFHALIIGHSNATASNFWEIKRALQDLFTKALSLHECGGLHEEQA